jgi:hypothetical protein
MHAGVPTCNPIERILLRPLVGTVHVWKLNFPSPGFLRSGCRFTEAAGGCGSEAVAPMFDAVAASGKRARLLQHPAARCGSDLHALKGF